MAVYPPAINARFCSPANAGRAGGVNGLGTAASFECGCFVRTTLAVADDTRTVKDARFQTNGCAYMAAAADVVAAHLAGRRLTELHSANEGEMTQLVYAELGVFPVPRLQCLSVVLESLRLALADYRAYLIEEFRGEKALICTCFGISEAAIESFIGENRPATVEEVTAACRAGGGCGSCRMIIQEMIDLQGAEGI